MNIRRSAPNSMYGMNMYACGCVHAYVWCKCVIMGLEFEWIENEQCRQSFLLSHPLCRASIDSLLFRKWNRLINLCLSSLIVIIFISFHFISAFACLSGHSIWIPKTALQISKYVQILFNVCGRFHVYERERERASAYSENESDRVKRCMWRMSPFPFIESKCDDSRHKIIHTHTRHIRAVSKSCYRFWI